MHSSFIDDIWDADLADNVFQKFLNKLGRKPNKIWVDKGIDIYNRSMKLWFQNNNIEMYSKHKEGQSVVAERFIRILNNKIYKYMNLISKNSISIN